MKEYHKIQTVFLRTPESNFKTLMEGHWALPEFELLKDIQWTWTEKIDGTNIRVLWNSDTVEFGGKTENAQLPATLMKVLQKKFTTERMTEVFADTTEVCLYGEGYGAKIQKGGNYLPDTTDFILFDVKIGEYWLTRESLEDIAAKLGIGIVPIIGKGPLMEAVELVTRGFKSTIAHNKDYDAEGLIMKPETELFNRQGNRIVAKIKFRDFIR
ncbi:RNA ligase family protein [Chryseolinea lacunae]|uniref:RNA ligase domain-containing protein n=1 Tax=Chryseolinea lacunae TaxID=2801331 RepID=A0ABS1KRP6_9BACT|nr:RNA ligase family protein [Chryseolinea lacunae]MBL0742039.1 hypothetical protein [Chryseolinea lacunae]